MRKDIGRKGRKGRKRREEKRREGKRREEKRREGRGEDTYTLFIHFLPFLHITTYLPISSQSY